LECLQSTNRTVGFRTRCPDHVSGRDGLAPKHDETAVERAAPNLVTGVTGGPMGEID
jgi:hypothetical protein